MLQNLLKIDSKSLASVVFHERISMNLALFTDEIYDFTETGTNMSGRTAIAGGWIVKNDQGHDLIR